MARNQVAANKTIYRIDAGVRRKIMNVAFLLSFFITLIIPATQTNAQDIYSEIINEFGGLVDATVEHNNTVYQAKGSGIQVFDFTDPNDPQKVYFQSTGDRPGTMVISDDYLVAYHADRRHLISYSIENPWLPVKVDSFQVSDSWLWFNRMTAQGNRIYAAARDSGLIILDIDEAGTMSEQGRIHESESVDFVFIRDNMAFLASGLRRYLAIYDISNIQTPQKIGEYRPDQSIRNLWADGSHIFLAAGSIGKLEIVDISNPSQPVLVHRCTSQTYVSDVYARGNRLFSLGSTFAILDISNITSPQVLDEIEYSGFKMTVIEGNGYNTVLLDGDGDYSLLTAQVSDAGQISIRSEIEEPGIVEGIAAADDFLYLGAWDDMWVMDISDPENPISVAKIPCGFVDKITVGGHWLYATSSWQDSLFVCDITNPNNPQLLSRFALPSLRKQSVRTDYLNEMLQSRRDTGILNHTTSPGIHDIAGRDNLLFVLDYTNTISVFDASSSPPNKISSYTLPGQGSAIDVNDTTLYAAWSPNVLGAISIQKPLQPRLYFQIKTNDAPACLHVYENLLYMGSSYEQNNLKLEIYDISNPASISSLGITEGLPGFEIMDVKVGEDIAFVGLAGASVGVIDAKNPYMPYTAQVVHSGTYTGHITTVVTPRGDKITYTGEKCGGSKIIKTQRKGNKYRLTSEVGPPNAGTVTPGGGLYDPGTNVNLEAKPSQTNSGFWKFKQWSGDAAGNNPNTTVTMDRDKHVIANFERYFTLTTAVDPDSSAGSIDPPPGQYTYPEGTYVPLYAEPQPGWGFSHWEGDVSGVIQTNAVTMDDDKLAIAVFAPLHPDLLINELNTSSNTEQEWIEIYNPHWTRVYVGGCKLHFASKNFYYEIPRRAQNWSGRLQSGEYLVIHFQDSTDTPGIDLYAGLDVAVMHDESDAITLYDAFDNPIDFVRYGENQIAPPVGTGWSGDNPQAPVADQTLGRDMNSTDIDTGSDWENTGGKDAEGPTPGVQNITPKPHLAVSDTSIAFGRIPVGLSECDTIRLQNVGQLTLSISDVVYNGIHYRLSAPELPWIIEANHSLDLIICFVPSMEGVLTDSLVLYSNDPDAGVVTVTLTGEGVLMPTVNLLSPVGGEIWQAGTLHGIYWQASGNELDHLTILYSKDAGAFYPYLLGDRLVNTGVMPWRLPDETIQTARVLIQAKNAAGAVIAADTSGNFSIIKDAGKLDEKWRHVADGAIRWLDHWEDGFAVADINGDNLPEIAYGHAAGGLAILEGTTGNMLWSRSLTNTETYVEADFIDIDDDGYAEIVAGGFSATGNAIIAVYDQNGQSIWNKTITERSAKDFAYADVDSDGDIDIVAAIGTGLPEWSGGGALVLDGKTGNEIWYARVDSGAAQAVDAADLDNDGYVEIAVSTAHKDSVGLVTLLNSHSKTIMMQTKGKIGQDVLFADLDGDNNVELLAGLSAVQAFSANGARMWHKLSSLDHIKTTQIDQETRVLTACPWTGQLRWLQAEDGKTLWWTDYSGVADLGDVDGDCIVDIVTATCKQHEQPIDVNYLAVRDLVGRVKCLQSLPAPPDELIVANIDSDPELEILVVMDSLLIAYESSTSAVSLATSGIVPNQVKLMQNYPNPFNSSTIIHYALEKRSDVVISIWDNTGRLVRSLEHSTKDKGWHSVTWNGSDEQGNTLPSGIYFYRLKAGNQMLVRRMVHVK